MVTSDNWRFCDLTFVLIDEGKHAGLVGINGLLRSETREPGGLPGGKVKEVERLIPLPDILLDF